MTIEQFLKTYDYQMDTEDEDITIYINSKESRRSMLLCDWKQQPYNIIMTKIKEWRLYSNDTDSGGPEIEIFI